MTHSLCSSNRHNHCQRKKQRGKKESISIRWVLCPQHPPAIGAWQMIQENFWKISHHHPKQLLCNYHPKPAENPARSVPISMLLILSAQKGSRASALPMFPGRGALIKHFSREYQTWNVSAWPVVACEKLTKHCKICFGSRGERAEDAVAVLSPPVQMLWRQGWPMGGLSLQAGLTKSARLNTDQGNWSTMLDGNHPKLRSLPNRCFF